MGEQHIAVLGAAGKMGRGIALLLLQLIAGREESVLTLFDANPSGFKDLKKYLKEQFLKYAERNINRLRLDFKDREDLIDNGEIIQAFLEEGLNRIRFASAIEECRGAQLIFEAIIEDVEAKVDVLSRASKIAAEGACFFSNTSSIPIHILQEKSHLKGRLVGFHFYNPPAVQKLLEIIIPRHLNEDVRQQALELGSLLDKTVVFARDIAGFIGNGHFIRETVEACACVEELALGASQEQALCTVNAITEEYLIRPMGIFQLIDYVGIDVVQNIARVMTKYLGKVFTTPLIESMVSSGIKGGQNGDGSQKDGFFSYTNGKPVKVYSLKNREYAACPALEEIKNFPNGYEPWKALSKDKDKKKKLEKYLANLRCDRSNASRLAVRFLENSRTIAHGLVKDGVAGTIEDVDTVLQQGFFHLYGVDEPWNGKGGAIE